MARAGEAARFLAGVLLAGYGALVVLRLLVHESLAMGAGLLVAGIVLLLTLPRPRALSAAEEGPRDRADDFSSRRRALVALLGAVAAGGTLLYNGLARSDLTVPEAAIVAYGLALLLASRRLGARLWRTDVGTLVAWSMPLVAAPLGMYAMDAYFDAQVGVGASPLDAFIAHGLVAPMAMALKLLGFDAVANGQVVALGTPRGKLFLSIGVVCAGLQPGVLFLGVFGLFAWQERTPPARLAALLALGLAGVYVANVVRLVALALVGYHKGGAALQTAHEHFGWMLFVGWMLAYWWLVLRRLQGAPRAPAPVA